MVSLVSLPSSYVTREITGASSDVTAIQFSTIDSITSQFTLM